MPREYKLNIECQLEEMLHKLTLALTCRDEITPRQVGVINDHFADKKVDLVSRVKSIGGENPTNQHILQVLSDFLDTERGLLDVTKYSKTENYKRASINRRQQHGC